MVNRDESRFLSLASVSCLALYLPVSCSMCLLHLIVIFAPNNFNQANAIYFLVGFIASHQV